MWTNRGGAIQACRVSGRVHITKKNSQLHSAGQVTYRQKPPPAKGGLADLTAKVATLDIDESYYWFKVFIQADEAYKKILPLDLST